MKLYVVGGAVRDALLGHPAADRDWVAVGATPEEMLALGYKAVGKDFPVFLHPQTGEEVALARTERKSGPGYRGFVVHAAPGVTLEEDLARRDLTINAIAQAEDGRLIDPYGGQRDLEARVLRHVSPAFVEDPVRLLRVARLAARFPQFTVAPETAALLQQMVAAGEVDALVPERVWQEISRGLMAQQPGRMLALLQACGAWPRLLPGVPVSEQRRHLLDAAAQAQAPLPVRWALLVREGEHAAAAERLRVPGDCRELAALLVREQNTVQGPPLNAELAVQLFERCDALRRPERFALLLQACALAEPSREVLDLWPLLQAASHIDTASVAAAAAAQGQRGPAIGAAVRAARVAAVQQRLG